MRLEAAIEKSLSLLFDHAAEAMFICDKSGVIKAVNQRFLALFGYEQEAILEQNVDVLLPDEIRSIHQSYRHEYSKSSYDRPMGTGFDDLVARHADGHIFPVEVSLSQIVYEDNVGLILGIVADITQRKQLEAQAQQVKAQQISLDKERQLIADRERLVSLLSHEFRNALSVVMLTASALNKKYHKLTPSRQQVLVRKLVTQIQTLRDLMNDVLEMQRTQDVADKAHYQTFDLVEMLSYWRAEFATEENMTHQFILDAPENLKITADRHALGYIIRNLISNAIKYSPVGGKIECTLSYTNDAMMLSVSDEGVGIPLDAIPHVFKPYWRADNVSHMQGTGLGLAIVKHYVDLHGGTIYCRSKLGEGTTFTVNLPLREAANTA